MKQILNNSWLLVIVGLIPTLAVVNYASGALLMGIAMIIVLVLSSLILASVREKLSGRELLVVYVFVVCTIATLLRMLMQLLFIGSFGDIMAYWNLIAVNALVVYPALVSGKDHSASAAVKDALSKGVLFAVLLFVLAAVREIFGAGAFFGMEIPFLAAHKLTLLSGTAGGFFLLGITAAVLNAVKGGKEGKDA